ncbi:MAG TPA: TolC family protein [Saprospiraceae bacterium]|nr:TolC family protein [Saprospiraceae bacterium]HNT22149.1 TolC family protein [Saprospiraceae bacterium]
MAQTVLRLDDAIEIALSQNPNILISSNEKEIAQVNNNWWAAGRIPTVGLNSTFNNSITNLNQKLNNGTVIERNGARNSTINVNGQFSYRIYGGKRMYIIKNRLDLEEALADEVLKQDINQTVFDVINRYIDIVRLKSQLDAVRETISFFEERSKLSQVRFEIGTAGKNDYLQSQVDLNVQRTSELNILNSIELAKMELNRVMVRDPFTAFEVEDIPAPEILPSREEMMQAIDAQNPQITALRFNQKILTQLREEILATQKPSVFANASANFNRNSSTAGFNLFTMTYGPQAGLSLSVPLFAGPIVRQQVKVNDLQYKNQDLQIQNVKNDLTSLAANAYQNYENANRQIGLEEQNLAIIREHNAISMERFRKASITTVELRQAQLNLIEAQNRIINSRFILRQSEAQILYVMGRLVEQ